MVESATESLAAQTDKWLVEQANNRGVTVEELAATHCIQIDYASHVIDPSIRSPAKHILGFSQVIKLIPCS
jgi:hypothetical protein